MSRVADQQAYFYGQGTEQIDLTQGVLMHGIGDASAYPQSYSAGMKDGGVQQQYFRGAWNVCSCGTRSYSRYSEWPLYDINGGQDF